MTYRQTGESVRCDTCGGSDIHSLGCASQVKSYLPEPFDITVGDVRVHAGRSGLIGLYRGDEAITLVPSEAVGIARVLLERFASGV